jgi:hypothetical protein
MATVAPNPNSPFGDMNCPSFPYLGAGYAQGSEGKAVGRATEKTASEWLRPSIYLAAMLGGPTESYPMNGLLRISVLLTTLSIGLAVAGLTLGGGVVVFPAAILAGLFAYRYFARWLAWRGDRSGFLGFLNRIRAALAYEGDPAKEPLDAHERGDGGSWK